jgi:FKBP-type peptidyl-prolyl cis-trans isomerase
VIGSCKTYSEKDLAQFDSKIEKYVKKSKIPYQRTETGLFLYIENEGEGDEFIKFTDRVTFSYVGKLMNGRIFDKKTKDNPVTYETRVLIEGWKEAFAYLKKGGKAKLVVPPQLGYGDEKLSDIPQNSILFFDVEILDVE